jgi:CRISPR/Cas system endoribonuclease Cas6 (RAMP superfamily)
MKRKLKEMEEEELSLDRQLADYNRQIKEDFLEKSEYKPYHYITFEDCEKICQSLSERDASKTLLIISAPKGAKL